MIKQNKQAPKQYQTFDGRGQKNIQIQNLNTLYQSNQYVVHNEPEMKIVFNENPPPERKKVYKKELVQTYLSSQQTSKVQSHREFNNQDDSDGSPIVITDAGQNIDFSAMLYSQESPQKKVVGGSKYVKPAKNHPALKLKKSQI